MYTHTARFVRTHIIIMYLPIERVRGSNTIYIYIYTYVAMESNYASSDNKLP